MIRSPAGFDGGDRIKRYLGYYQPSYGVMMLSAGQFSPLSLFAAGEPGVWYDPSDFTTMFQDAAGTTPVTAVEQPVGLLLDKSKGLALGSELVTNGDFSNGSTGWTLVSSSVVGGALNCLAVISTQFATRSITVVAGRTYQVSFTVTNYTSGNIFLTLGVGANVSTASVGANGVFTSFLVAGAGNSEIRMGSPGTGFVGTLDNISVRELPGNHASQATPTSCPVLSARVNLLTYSEQFDNAAWTESGGATATGGQLAPDGTYTAGRIVLSTGSAYGSYVLQTSLPNQPSAPMKFRSYVWCASGTQKVTIGILQSGVTAHYSGYKTITTTPTVIEHTAQFASGGSGTGLYFITGPDGVGADFFVWQPDLRVTNVGVGLPAYQRVAAATDYDTTGFPLYLKFDGTDDSLTTGSINFSVTDKMSVFAGARKIGTSQGILVETSAGAASNSGAFFISAPNDASPNYAFLENGGGSLRYTVPTTYTSPITNVLSCGFDLGTTTLANSVTSRINATLNQTGLTQTAQTTGNFGTYSLFVGRRNQVTLPFNGNLYSLIVRGAASTDAQIVSTETWVNGKTKAY